jgi:hypothetical protein
MNFSFVLHHSADCCKNLKSVATLLTRENAINQKNEKLVKVNYRQLINTFEPLIDREAI